MDNTRELDTIRSEIRYLVSSVPKEERAAMIAQILETISYAILAGNE